MNDTKYHKDFGEMDDTPENREKYLKKEKQFIYMPCGECGNYNFKVNKEVYIEDQNGMYVSGCAPPKGRIHVSACYDVPICKRCGEKKMYGYTYD